MLRKKLESESGIDIADSGFLIFYEKPVDYGYRIRIAIPDLIIERNFDRTLNDMQLC